MGKRVECEIEQITQDDQPAIQATCTQCEHSTVSFGTTERSVKRCLALMREQCPEGEENFYVEEE
jgi:hypothetical protein